jgi:hypothetical protein
VTVLHVFWLPILLSSVFVFVASSLIHMAFPSWHKSDYVKIPQEDKIMDALRPFTTPPGDYMVPSCDTVAEMRSQEFADKLAKGPVLVVTVMPNGRIHMGKCLGLWFVYLIVVSCFSAYVGCHSMLRGAASLKICQVVGVTAFLAYAGALWQMSIWYRRSWVTTLKATIDGLIYAGITAATFGWLWPK